VALESGAYLVGLRRTRIGEMCLEDAWMLKDFIEKLQENETKSELIR